MFVVMTLLWSKRDRSLNLGVGTYDIEPTSYGDYRANIGVIGMILLGLYRGYIRAL